ncbi:hypothetical protein Lepto7376_2517 [[Leptolyngbya] sp. PCC 7376]|nr:hypothetical protein Lepto7376_2517 [[Leptolyngbya] sp. PCC 7376]
MTDGLLVLEIIGVVTVACIVLAPIFCWVLPHHFYAS